MTATIDDQGRIQLPLEVHKDLDLGPGDALDLQTGAAGTIVLSPHDRSALQERSGVLVHTGVPESDLADAIRRIRAERDRSIAGGMEP